MSLIFIGSSSIVFLLIILTLSFSLLIAESKLVNKGKVKIVINDDASKSLETEAGSTLLNTLSTNGILLPSACGGGGTCGVCRCRITEGGGDLLPTEEGQSIVKTPRKTGVCPVR